MKFADSLFFLANCEVLLGAFLLSWQEGLLRRWSECGVSLLRLG